MDMATNYVRCGRGFILKWQDLAALDGRYSCLEWLTIRIWHAQLHDYSRIVTVTYASIRCFRKPEKWACMFQNYHFKVKYVCLSFLHNHTYGFICYESYQ
jgi:hypothetical protein